MKVESDISLKDYNTFKVDCCTETLICLEKESDFSKKVLEKYIKSNPPYTHIIADEIQDFGIAEMILLKSLVKDGTNNILLCCDSGQRIYMNQFKLSQIGIETKGRSYRLKINYRTTEQIKKFSDKILPDNIEEIDSYKYEDDNYISKISSEKNTQGYNF